MTQEEVDKIYDARDGKQALKLVKELVLRVEALEKRGELPAAPTSASEIPDVQPQAPAPTPEPIAPEPTPAPAPVETPEPSQETPAQ